MKILVAGSHGVVGSAVTRRLVECGYKIILMVRRKPGPGEVWWNPDAGERGANSSVLLSGARAKGSPNAAS